MGRSPRSPPSSHKHDTVGGELRFTSPDRSWCGTTSPGTNESGDTDQQPSRNGLREEPLPAGGEGKPKQLLGTEAGRTPGDEVTVCEAVVTHRFRAGLHSAGAPLRRTYT